jgi:peptidoglycan/LPS O-acetylase OafA/YrhL
MFSQPVDRSRSDGLDALRFLLALWVLLVHVVGFSLYMNGASSIPVLAWVNQGLVWLFQRNGETHPAVLAFIVLSGYCIHRNGYRQQSNFSLKAFGVRRFFRIVPVYWLGVGLGIGLFQASLALNAAAAKALSGTGNISVQCMAVKLLGASSFLPSLHECSFEGNAPLTTVMVEIWLYALYALVIYAAQKKMTSPLMAGLAIFWCVMFGYVLLNPGLSAWWHNGSLISFAPYWWLGAYFAEYGPRSINCKHLVRLWLYVGIVLVLVGSLGASLYWVELRKAGLALLIALVIRWLDSGRAVPLLAKAGAASYDIYAFHAPVLIFLLLNKVNLVWLIVAPLVVGMIGHLVFERPLLEQGRRLATRISLEVR